MKAALRTKLPKLDRYKSSDQPGYARETEPQSATGDEVHVAQTPTTPPLPLRDWRQAGDEAKRRGIATRAQWHELMARTGTDAARLMRMGAELVKLLITQQAARPAQAS
jgi:hypothetical protein